jgi:hypothetical protein
MKHQHLSSIPDVVKPRKGISGRWPAMTAAGMDQEHLVWLLLIRQVDPDSMQLIFCRALRASCKDGLILFLTDGRIEMDSNAVERTVRPIALQRKNALFAGHDAGAQNWAMLASLIETCKLNKIEPHSYLTVSVSVCLSLVV